jgi:hypothetical protein
MRYAEKLSGYYEMPMAIVMRIVITVMAVVVRAVIAAMTITVLMVLVAMTVMMGFLGTLFIRPASLDMNMGNMVSRMAVPQGRANTRCGPPVKQQ